MNGLDDKQLRIHAPSIFAERPWHEVSDRYIFVPTINVINALRDKGWFPMKAQQSRSRIPGKGDFTKHMIRFRQDMSMIVGNVYPEIILLNSHDRGSSFQMVNGLYRLVCGNGMTATNAEFTKESIMHLGDRNQIIEQILDTLSIMAARTPKLAESVSRFQTIELTRDEQGAYAEAAAEIRWGRDEENRIKSPVPVEKLNDPKRTEDRGDSLWHTFNRVQEQLIKGGASHVEFNRETWRRQRRSVRAINSVGEDQRLNSALWALTEKMAELKAA